MRDVLRAEFGDLAPLVQRIPRPALARSGDVWRALAAVGAAWVAGSVGGTLVSVVIELFDPRRVSDLSWSAHAFVQLVGAGGGVAVARSGGIRPLWIFLAFEGLVLALGLLRTVTSIPIAVERGLPISMFDPVTFLIGRWPSAIGILLGLMLARHILSSSERANPLLEAAGTRLAASRLAYAVLGLAVPFADERILPVAIALTFGSDIAAGIVIAVRARRPLVTAVVLAVIVVGTWIWPIGAPQIALQIGEGRPPVEMIIVAVPAAEAIVVILVAIVIDRARRVRRSLPS